jgi:hypothetical protein
MFSRKKQHFFDGGYMAREDWNVLHTKPCKVTRKHLNKMHPESESI